MDQPPAQPDWVPPEGGEGFATRIRQGVPAAGPGQPVPGRLPGLPPADLAQRILAGDRAALARGITLIESRAPAHREMADELLNLLTPRAGGSRRIGLSGLPGAGKSTFIDTLGLQLCAADRRVAVLSVDPSSPVTGGSILGDKTRMERLARHPHAYIRPSPSGGELGGVTRRTRESITLCEAAGFDIVLVETVGVGQSEVLVRGMVDCFVVLMIAGAGDELQGMKKGILELADIVVVNKADGENRLRAETARLEFERALHYVSEGTDNWVPPVLACSARSGAGVAELWKKVDRFMEQAESKGTHAGRRREQAVAWLHALVQDGLREIMRASPAVVAEQTVIEQSVAEGRMSAPTAARRLLDLAGFGSG